MSSDMSDWPASKKLKHSLLRRAFNENRGAEMILLIQWLYAKEDYFAEKSRREFLMHIASLRAEAVKSVALDIKQETDAKIPVSLGISMERAPAGMLLN